LKLKKEDSTVNYTRKEIKKKKVQISRPYEPEKKVSKKLKSRLNFYNLSKQSINDGAVNSKAQGFSI
jgi:hypothetical protein